MADNIYTFYKSDMPTTVELSLADNGTDPTINDASHADARAANSLHQVYCTFQLRTVVKGILLSNLNPG